MKWSSLGNNRNLRPKTNVQRLFLLWRSQHYEECKLEGEGTVVKECTTPLSTRTTSLQDSGASDSAPAWPEAVLIKSKHAPSYGQETKAPRLVWLARVIVCACLCGGVCVKVWLGSARPHSRIQAPLSTWPPKSRHSSLTKWLRGVWWGREGKAAVP